jgi:cob(I)alamin adenosyltransferase
VKYNKGYIHLYTGNGKGKTTAAFGLAIRAVGAGRSVFIAQFVKGMPYSELDTFKRIPEIEIKQYGLDCFIKNKPSQKDIDAAQIGFKEITSIIATNSVDLLILDEICIALYYHLFDEELLLNLLKAKPKEMEIVLTGRYASKVLYEIADLITEMKEVKHYYNDGVEARKGIEY